MRNSDPPGVNATLERAGIHGRQLLRFRLHLVRNRGDNPVCVSIQVSRHTVEYAGIQLDFYDGYRHCRSAYTLSTTARVEAFQLFSGSADTTANCVPSAALKRLAVVIVTECARVN